MKWKIPMRWIALLLTILIFVTLFLVTGKDVAYAFPFKDKYEFLSYVETMGLPTSWNGYEINYDVYKDKKLMVYGKPSDVEDNEFKNGEWRYLGYSIFGGPFTNQDFPNDPGASGSPDTWKKFISSDYAQRTWDTLLKDFPELYDYNLNSTLQGHGSSNLTCASIGTDKVRLLSPATIYANGAAYVEFINKYGMKRYATFTIPAMSYSSLLDGEIITNSDHFTILQNQNEITIQVTVKAEVDLIGAIQANHIKKIRAEAIDVDENILSYSEVSSATSVSTTYNLVLSRQQYGPGTHAINLDGRVLFSTIFNDMDAKNVSKTIHLTVEAADVGPVAIIDAPGGSEVGKSVTVSGENSYSSNGDIVDYDWYIEQIEAAEGEEIDPDIPDNLTISGSKDSVRFPHVGKYRIKLTVTDVLGKTDTTTHTIRIEKGNIPPEAILIVPDTVRVGDNVKLDGSDSFDFDGYIDRYEWYVYPSDDMHGSLYNLSRNTIWFETEGVKDIDMLIWDNLGAMSGDSASIEVLPPQPIAKLNYTGTLKVNRKITLDATESNGPDHYPITSWDWEVIASNGGDIDSVKYHGELDGNNKKEIIIKKAGRYIFRLTVSNDLGYSDTTSITLDIAEDEGPIISLNTLEYVLRDPNNDSLATIDAKDESTSPDGDYIAHSNFTLVYDSDNDNSFDDETPIDVQDITNYVYKTKDVGKYLLKLETVEGFSQETILDFITPEDYKKAKTEVIIEVGNVAPVVDFKMLDPIEVNLIFAVGNTSYSDNVIKNKINSIIIPKLEANGLKLNYSIKHYNPHLPMACDDIYVYARFKKQSPAIYSTYNLYEYDIQARTKTRFNVYDWCAEKEILCTYDGKAIYWVEYDIYDSKVNIVNHYDALYFRDTVSGKTYTIANLRREVEDSDDPYDEDFTFDFVRLNRNNEVIYGYKGVTYIYDLNTRSCRQVTENEEYDNGYSYNQMVYTTPNGLTFENIRYRGDSEDKYDLRLYVRNRFTGTRVKIDSDDNESEYDYYVPGKFLPNCFGDDLDIMLSDNMDDIFDYSEENYLVSLDDTIIEEFTNENIKKSMSNMLNQYNGGYFGIGSLINQENTENFISMLNSGGAFADISDFDAALNDLADMIIEKEKPSEEKIIRYFLINEEVEYETFYYDMENDPMYSQKWIINHTNPYYFENSLGVYEFTGKEQNAPVSIFDKTGEYEIISQVRDNPKNDNRFDDYRLWSNTSNSTLKIYVHRRPIADFRYSYNYSFSCSSTSYDMDHISLPNHGIINEEWKWKYHNEDVWREGKPYGIGQYDRIYLYLRVQDIEGVWSEPMIKYIYCNRYNDVPPIASFVCVPNPLPINEELQVDDNSYDPNGDPIVSREWEISKFSDGSYTPIYSGESSTCPITNFSTYGIGKYRISLRVASKRYSYSSPKWSSYCYQYFEVIDDPLTINVEPSNREWDNKDVNVSVSISGSSYDYCNYKWSISSSKPTSGWNTTQSSSFDLSQSSNGVWYLHIEAYKSYGTSYYLCVGPYKVDKIGPVVTFSPNSDISYTGSISTLISVSDSHSGLSSWRYRTSSDNGSTWSSWSSFITNNSQSITFSEVGSYYIQVEAIDLAGNLSSATSGEYAIYELKIDGLVCHTPKWEENRIKYNLSVSGTEDSPRTYDIFFPGEKFVLNATTTDGVDVDRVDVVIEGYPYSTTLTNEADNIWTGFIWHEDMVLWDNRTLSFKFTVYYSIGIIKEDTVTIQIIDDEYYRVHRKF